MRLLFCCLASALAPALLPLGPAPAVQDPPALPASPEATAAAYFELCDYDRSGWISFREAQESMSVEREDFPLFDRNSDGRIDLEEFTRRYRETVDQVGGFKPPRASASAGLPPKRSAEQLRAAYDRDADAALSENELAKVLAEYRLALRDAASALRLLDLDGDGRASGGELEQLAQIIAATLNPGLLIAEPESAGSLRELFGRSQPRARLPGRLPDPDRIAGPLTHFERLDVDGNGWIEESDLKRLQSPLQSSVRPITVIVVLDTDGDGRLTRAEFAQSFAGD